MSQYKYGSTIYRSKGLALQGVIMADLVESTTQELLAALDNSEALVDAILANGGASPVIGTDASGEPIVATRGELIEAAEALNGQFGCWACEGGNR